MKSYFIRTLCLLLSLVVADTNLVARERGKASVYVEENGSSIIVRDSSGEVLHEQPLGQDDAAGLQWAIDVVQPGGAVQLCAGHYILDRPIELANPVALMGEGNQTIIRPPPGDFAIRVLRKASSHTRNEIIRTAKGKGWDEVITGVSISDLCIDGGRAGTGKGIYLAHVGQSAFKSLWILRTTDGAAIYLGEQVIEATFSGIHLLDNGNVKAKEASIVLATQETGDADNNIHFDDVFVIFPNYIGMEVGAGTGSCVPRLIFIDQCMFHGWLGQSESPTGIENNMQLIPAPFDLIKVSNLDLEMVIRDSRITNGGEKSAHINVERGTVKLLDNVIGGGRVGCYIRAGAGTQLSARGNTFQSPWNTDGSSGIVLESDGAAVTFENNIMAENTGPVRLKRPEYAIITHNVFRNVPADRAVEIDSTGKKIIVKDNVYLRE